MFKSLIGKGHPEFSTNRQQDAQEFFLHFINMVEVMVESICQMMEKPSFVFSPQQGVRGGSEKLAIRAEKGREHREMGQLASVGAEKERCLAMFSGLIPWRNLSWEWHDWRCELSSLGAGNGMGSWGREVGSSLLFAVFSSRLGTEVNSL